MISRHVLVGHGDIPIHIPEPGAPDMNIVAIPEGTTIQFWSDSGQALDYNNHQLDVFHTFTPQIEPLDSRHVTYNLRLVAARELWGQEFQNNPQFGGREIIRPGFNGVPEEIYMCTGSPDSCPTRPADIQRGMKHTCDGILGQLSGDLHWLACTTFRGGDPEVTAARTNEVSRNVLLGEHPDWIPDMRDAERMAEKNHTNIKNARNGATPEYVICEFGLLIGGGHDLLHQTYVAGQGGRTHRGRVRIVKGSNFSAGKLKFDSVPPELQEYVRISVRRFSRKTVYFV
ncbi:hypothetical protein AB0D66_32860 [Streptomyces sp. NPDC048270]|uniref:hypothetical protein n=1 Tax=Streptomyces sp. NPDC048270 TaxID=3154615 RepID=UPI0033DBBDE4